MKKLTLIFALLLPALLFAQQDTSIHTFKIKKGPGEVFQKSDALIKIGSRTLHNNDTITASVILKAGKIVIADTTGTDSIIGYASSLNYNGTLATWVSRQDSLPVQITTNLTYMSNFQNSGSITIYKVRYKTTSGEKYESTKSTNLRIVVPFVPDLSDTSTAWLKNFKVSIDSITVGKIGKRKLLKAGAIQVKGPAKQIVVTSFDITVEYNRPEMFMSTKLNSAHFAQSGSAAFTKDMRKIIQDSDTDSRVIISNVTIIADQKTYILKKGITLTIQ
ncbi:MAG TPA: hypothetical protein VK890_10395 [Bacteroidia bacterium]|jgi:hypothetical protein|nr:hypothetical protein [Bacteroidia bacterium]